MDSPPKKTKNIPKPTHFGKNLKFLRRLKGLSQTELAKILDLNRSKIASYESGMVEPNSGNFLKISGYFEVSSQDFLSQILSDNPLEILASPPPTNDPLDNYLQDQMTNFTKQTNEMTKIYEGYHTLLELKKEEMTEETGPLYSILDDLLDILHKLIEANWKLIQNIFPGDDQEQ